MQPHMFGVPPPPQVSGDWQVPQLTAPPQPSEMEPQSCPGGHEAEVRGVHPQACGTPPPPHVSGDEQVPQPSVPPQPSEMEPQF